METRTFPVEIMKRGAQSLWMKMRNAEFERRNVELILKGATVIYGL